VAEEGAAATPGTTEDTGGGRQGAVAAEGVRRSRRGGSSRVKDFGFQPGWNEPKPNQIKPIILTT
jgi:hypothetical protein